MANKLKGLQEGRAIFAYDCVINVQESKDIRSEYKSYSKKIPTMIQINGLGPTLAFIYSKGKVDAGTGNKAYALLYENIEKRLKDIGIICINDKLIEFIVKVDSTTYREITLEVLSLFSWLRRFTDGMIEGE